MFKRAAALEKAFPITEPGPSEAQPLMNLNASIIKLPQKILKANVLLVCEGKHLYKIMVFPLITIRVSACALRGTSSFEECWVATLHPFLFPAPQISERRRRTRERGSVKEDDEE